MPQKSSKFIITFLAGPIIAFVIGAATLAVQAGDYLFEHSSEIVSWAIMIIGAAVVVIFPLRWLSRRK